MNKQTIFASDTSIPKTIPYILSLHTPVGPELLRRGGGAFYAVEYVWVKSVQLMN